MIEKEITARQYTIKIDLKAIMDSDAFYENENQMDEMLYFKLDKLEGVSNVDYNGHFGNYIWLTVDAQYDNDELWKKIDSIITCRLAVWYQTSQTDKD